MFAAANVGLLASPTFAGTQRPLATSAGNALAASVPALDGVTDLGRAPQSLPVSLAVTLAYRHPAELEQLIALQSDASSRYYHQYLSNDRFAAYFAPSAATEASVIASFRRAGFTVATTFPNRTVVDVVAPAAVAERYFQTQFHSVMQPAPISSRSRRATNCATPDPIAGSTARGNRVLR